MPRAPVPERERKAAAAAAKTDGANAKAVAEKREALSNKKREYMRRAVKYAKQYRAEKNSMKSLRKTAEKEGNFMCEADAKVAFVIRIRGINDVAPKPRKILQLLRLRQIHTGVFVRLNKAVINMLRRVEPFIAWGYPSVSTIRTLVYKRGYMNIKGNRIPITENEVVQEALEKKTKGAIICAEDVVNQLTTAGDHFSAVSHTLWPFKLSAPNGGLKYKNAHFVEGGDVGNREALIKYVIIPLMSIQGKQIDEQTKKTAALSPKWPKQSLHVSVYVKKFQIK